MKTITFDFVISKTEISIPFEAICLVTDKKFGGDVIITYRKTKTVLEYVNVENEITAFTSNKTSAEELCNNIYLAVKESLKKATIDVEIDVKYSEAHQPARILISDLQ